MKRLILLAALVVVPGSAQACFWDWFDDRPSPRYSRYYDYEYEPLYVYDRPRRSQRRYYYWRY